jgi:hypothetical protein
MNFLSGILKSDLPTKGLRTKAETLKIPMSKPISALEDPLPAR